MGRSSFQEFVHPLQFAGCAPSVSIGSQTCFRGVGRAIIRGRPDPPVMYRSLCVSTCQVMRWAEAPSHPPTRAWRACQACSSALSDSCRPHYVLKLVPLKSRNVSKALSLRVPNAPTIPECGPYVASSRPLASSRDTLHYFPARSGRQRSRTVDGRVPALACCYSFDSGNPLFIVDQKVYNDRKSSGGHPREEVVPECDHIGRLRILGRISTRMP